MARGCALSLAGLQLLQAVVQTCGPVHLYTLMTLREHTCPPQAELANIDSYLESMGVKDARLRRHLETQLPGADAAALGAASGGRPRQAVEPLSAAARNGSSAAPGGLPTLLVCCDAGGGLGGLEPMLAALDLPAFVVCLPEGDVEGAPADVADLAALAIKATRGVVPAGSRLVVAGERLQPNVCT